MTDIAWLKELSKELWPPQEPSLDAYGRPIPSFKLEASRRLTQDEWVRLKKTIVEHKLIVEMVITNMFGGVGVALYAHPSYPGLPAEPLLLITQDHLPGEKEPEPTEGLCLREAWETFSVFTHTEQNQSYLKQYGLELPRSAGHYDY